MVSQLKLCPEAVGKTNDINLRNRLEDRFQKVCDNFTLNDSKTVILKAQLSRHITYLL